MRVYIVCEPSLFCLESMMKQNELLLEQQGLSDAVQYILPALVVVYISMLEVFQFHKPYTPCCL